MKDVINEKIIVIAYFLKNNLVLWILHFFLYHVTDEYERIFRICTYYSWKVTILRIQYFSLMLSN